MRPPSIGAAVRPVNLTVALSIHGWMSENELRWLALQAQTARVWVEVGCFVGRSARAVLDHMPDGGVIHCIDPFLPYNEDAIIPSHKDGDARHQELLDNLCDGISRGSALVHRFYSLDAARMFPLRSVDFVFIDADHTQAAVTADILAWAPAVCSGGTLAGHDYSTYPTVAAGVQAARAQLAITRPGLAIERPVDSIWSIRL